MAIEVKLPELGEGVESGDVLEVLVKEGDVVAEEQGLMELETDKATVTVPSPAAGRIAKLLVEPGQTVAVGQVVAHIEAASADSAPSAPAAPSQEEAGAPSGEAAASQPAQSGEQTQAAGSPPPS
ncbi:MAG: biotin/lipoyl-binding protein, partial [Planctomycetota bacterium]